MPAKATKTIRHTVKLQGFDLENGKISFSLLAKLNEQLLRLSESTLRSFVIGNSSLKRGKQAEWLTQSLDFNLSGLKSGSTILEVDAPMLKDTMGAMQVPLFGDLPVDDVTSNSALGLGLYAFEKAMQGDVNSFILDKHLLKEMRQFGKFLNKRGSSIEVSTGKKAKVIKLKKEVIEKIKTIEDNTPASIKTKVTGVLDMMKHSNHQLELLVDGTKRIRAILNDQLAVSDLTAFFGKELTVSGIANYNPSGDVISFEISGYKSANKKETYFNQLPVPLFEETDLKRIAQQQNYKGYQSDKVKNIAGKMEIEDSLEDLLAALK
jgi:hypothetical protein